jgi:cell wall-associated NlpC family hydrolase
VGPATHADRLLMLRPRLLIVLFALALTLPAPAAAAGREETELGVRIARYAKKFVGVPYVYGGMSPRGFDCSGFTAYVYRRFGIKLPHYTVTQFRRGRNVRVGRLRPGDLVFFHGLGHVGLYVGRGRFIHAPRRGMRVRVEPLAGWYRSRLVGVRRFVRWE